MSNIFLDAGAPATGRKVMLATTAYDSPDAAYTHAMACSREPLHQAGIQTAYLLLQGNCHVDDARNAVVAEFLKSDCNELVFIDADVVWRPEHLLTLLEAPCKGILGGVYPFRREDARKSGRMPFQPKRGVTTPDDDGVMPVDGLPTGFMRITRACLERLASSSQTYWQKNDREARIPLVFERTMIEGQRWGGDLYFCRKARSIGFQVDCIPEMWLGHVGKQKIEGSVAASFRMAEGTTLKHLVDRVRSGQERPCDYREGVDALDNPWGAVEDVLAACVLLARQADGPIIEAGSGLTTILMAAATDHPVYAMESSEEYARRLAAMCEITGLDNVFLVATPIKDGFYDLTEDRADMPERFALGLVDGPPREQGDRLKFFEHFPDCGTYILDDCDDYDFLLAARKWAFGRGLTITRPDKRLGVIHRAAKAAAAE